MHFIIYLILIRNYLILLLNTKCTNLYDFTKNQSKFIINLIKILFNNSNLPGVFLFCIEDLHKFILTNKNSDLYRLICLNFILA